MDGASIDYSKTKTIQIADFPIRSSYVWGPMGPMFNNALKDQFANHTKLIQVKRNGDMKIEGEITQYSQRNKSVSSEGYSAQTELSITVNVRFTNNANHAEDFERQFTASQTYETTRSLNSVQEELVIQMCKDFVIIGVWPFENRDTGPKGFSDHTRSHDPCDRDVVSVRSNS